MDPRYIQRFRIDAVLGRGGMGEVYRAYDSRLDRSVAIKILAAGAPLPLDERSTVDLRTQDLRPAAGQSTTDDLLSEARVMARVSDPHVLPIYEVGLDARGVFLVMELVEGSHLRAWLAAPRAVPDILGVLVQAARGLAAAHARGIVHRDFKPENVLVGADGRARVADFGISTLVRGRADGRMAYEGAMLAGTPQYMAPELWRGEPATERTDVYAFAVAAIEALTGAIPGDGDAGRNAAAAALVARGVAAPGVRALVAGLAEQPALRPPDGAALVSALTARRSRLPQLAAGVLAASALGGVALAFAFSSSAPAEPACDPDPARFAGRWDAAARSALAAAVDPKAPDASAVAARAVARADGIVAADTALRIASCREHAAGKLTAAQLAARTACLDRRRYELGARANYIANRAAAKGAIEPSLAAATIQSLPSVESCTVVEGAALATPAAHAAAEEQYQRLTNGADLVAPKLIAMLEPLIRDAAAAGDPELASRAAAQFGQRSRDVDAAKADAVLAEAHRHAQAAKSDFALARALIERTDYALSRHDLGGGRAFAALALELVERPHVSPNQRAAIFNAAGRAATAHGDPEAALRHAERGLAALDPEAHPRNQTRIDLLLGQLRALELIEGRIAERNRLAPEVVELARASYRGRGGKYRSALTLARRAAAAAGDQARVRAYDKMTLDSYAGDPTWNRAGEVYRRAALALELVRTAQFDEAYAQYTAAAKEAETAPEMKKDRLLYVMGVAIAAAGLGRLDEAHALASDALVDFTVHYGKDHGHTLTAIEVLATFEVQLDRLDDAERRIAAIERLLRGKREPTDERRAELTGTWRGTLLLARGDAVGAERVTREALAKLDELRGSAAAKSKVRRVRIEALNALARWPEARELALAELANERAGGALAPTIASLEFQLARADYELGDRAAAIARARDSAHVLETWRETPRLRREVADWLTAKSADRTHRP